MHDASAHDELHGVKVVRWGCLHMLSTHRICEALRPSGRVLSVAISA
jgi:hypothetical protein